MLKNFFLTVTVLLVNCHLCAQEISIKGEVYDEYLVPFTGAKIKSSKGKRTISDGNGIFNVKLTLPETLTVYADGYQTEVITVDSENQEVSLILKVSSKLDEVVMSASRTPERIFESPVSVTRLSMMDIKRTPSTNFYDGLEDVRGVTTYSGGVLTKMINTRGFTDMQNFRFVQMIDGVDNSYTQTNLIFGNLFGIADMDVASIEVLPGASSALYGPNAFNGVILINSKDPFEYSGITAEIESGVTTQNSGTKPYYNPSIRMGYQFNDKFAAKVNFSFYSGEEWHAEDYRDIVSGRVIESSERIPYYNGVNIYGDETVANLKIFAYGNFLQNPTPENYAKVIGYPNVSITKTGYKEEDLTDNHIENKKFSGSFYYRPFGNDRLQIKWTSRFSLGDQFWQVSPSRYTQKDAYYRQHILEFKGSNYFLRGFQTKTDMGDEYYNHLKTAVLLNNRGSSLSDWRNTYIKEFVPLYNSGIPVNEADAIARKTADESRLIPGTPKFNSTFNRITSTLSTEGGSKSYAVSRVEQIEGNFDFSKYTDFLGVMIGGSYRNYNVNTKGTTFTDADAPIGIYEYGIYGQLKKTFLDDRLKLMGTLRYDKSKNFDGHLSPRVAANYVFGEDKNHNFRVSYQTAFRNPTIENQYLGVQTGPSSFVIGNIPENLERFNKKTFSGQTVNKELLSKAGFSSKSIANFFNTGIKDFKDSYGAIDIFNNAKDNAKLLKTINYSEEVLNPEDVTAYETGYRGLYYISNKMVEVDINAYYNKYENLITKRTILIPFEGDPTFKSDFNFTAQDLMSGKEPDDYLKALKSITTNNIVTATMPINSKAAVHSYGVLASIKTKLFDDYDFGLSYGWTDYNFDEKKDPDFKPGFNTPEHSFKATLGHKKFFGRIGFNISYRWQSEYDWQSAYADGMIESRSSIDAQISIMAPEFRSKFKIGGNNIAGKEYLTAIGTPAVGSKYFISWIIAD